MDRQVYLFMYIYNVYTYKRMYRYSHIPPTQNCEAGQTVFLLPTDAGYDSRSDAYRKRMAEGKQALILPGHRVYTASILGTVSIVRGTCLRI